MVGAKNRMFNTPSGKIVTVQDALKAGVITTDQLPTNKEEAIALANNLDMRDRDRVLESASDRLGFMVNNETIKAANLTGVNSRNEKILSPSSEILGARLRSLTDGRSYSKGDIERLNRSGDLDQLKKEGFIKSISPTKNMRSSLTVALTNKGKQFQQAKEAEQKAASQQRQSQVKKEKSSDRIKQAQVNLANSGQLNKRVRYQGKPEKAAGNTALARFLISKEDGVATVSGFVKGNYGVFKDGSDYSLTHLPTGKSVTSFNSKRLQGRQADNKFRKNVATYMNILNNEKIEAGKPLTTQEKEVLKTIVNGLKNIK